MAWASFSQAITSSLWAISATPLTAYDRLPAAQHTSQRSCHYLEAMCESECSVQQECEATETSGLDGDQATMEPHERTAEDRSNGANGTRPLAPIPTPE